MQYIVTMGKPNGSQVHFGTFASHSEANKFMNEELSPKTPLGFRFHVSALYPAEYVTSRKQVSFIGL